MQKPISIESLLVVHKHAMDTTNANLTAEVSSEKSDSGATKVTVDMQFVINTMDADAQALISELQSLEL